MINLLMLFFLFITVSINGMEVPRSPIAPIPKLKLTPDPSNHQEEHEPYYFPPPSHYLSDSSYYEDDLQDKVSFDLASDAAFQCNICKLKSLVNKGNINRINDNGEPILFSAIKGSFKNPQAPIRQVLEFLFENGACIDTVEFNHKMSGLEFVTRMTIKNKKKDFRALAYFISAGADPFLQLPKRKCAFDVAVGLDIKNTSEKYPHTKAVLAFFRNRTFTLEDAITAFDVDKVRELATPGTVNLENIKNKKPLFTAISRFNQCNKNETLEIIEILLKNGADPNEGIRYMPLPGNNHIIVATIISILKGDAAMLPSLLRAGGNPFKSLVPGMSPSAYVIADVASTSKTNFVMQSNQGKKIKVEYSKATALNIVHLFEMWNAKDNTLQK